MGKEQQVALATPSPAPVTEGPAPAQDFGSNAEISEGVGGGSGADTPTLDTFSFGADGVVASATDGSVDGGADAWSADEDRPAAASAPAASTRKLDAPFTRTVDGETYTLRWTTEDGTPRLQVQEGDDWEEPSSPLLRKLGYDASVAAEESDFMAEGGGELLRAGKELLGDDRRQKKAFVEANDQARRGAAGDVLARPRQLRGETRATMERGRLAEISGDPEAIRADPDIERFGDDDMKARARAQALNELTQQKNRLGSVVKTVEKASWEKAFNKEQLFAPIPVLGPITLTPGVGVAASVKVGMLSNPMDDFDMVPDGLGAKATLPFEVGGEASVGGEGFFRFGHPNIGFDGVGSIKGSISGKGSAEAEIGVNADDGVTAEGTASLSAEGGLSATVSGRFVISFGGFRETIEVGDLLSIDLLKLSWTPAEMAWKLLPERDIETAAMWGGMAFDLAIGESSGGMLGFFTDWLNEDDQAHEKIQALKKEGLFDLLDEDTKIELLSALDDSWTGDAHEGSMADLYLSQPRGLPFIDFVQRYYEKDKGEAPDEDERYEELSRHLRRSVLDDNKQALRDVQKELDNSFWVLDPDQFLSRGYQRDYSLPGGHRDHWRKKANKEGRLNEFVGFDVSGFGW